MHNCKEAKEQLTESLLDGRPVEVLDQCGECCVELEALAATLRMTSRLRETVTPGESYWTNYHADLRGKLDQFHTKAQRLRHKTQREELKPGLGFVSASLRPPLRLCVNTFLLPIRLPLGLVMLIIAGVIGLFMIRTARQPSPQIPAPVVVHVPVEVPVIKERTVTQVVYRDRQKPLRSAKRSPAAPAAENTFAQFKPADDIKLTVIKGGSPNEK